MSFVRPTKLNRKWFEIGYVCGASSVKEVEESPNLIKNLGRQDVKIVPKTDEELISLVIGIETGRRYIYENFGKVKSLNYQDKNAHSSKGKYLTLGMTTVHGEPGITVRMPLSICNNTMENRGYVGFQAKIKYPSSRITLQNIIQANPSLTTFKYTHDAGSGVVSIQGLMENVSYSDRVQCYLEFYIHPDTVTNQVITIQGPSGKGTGSDVLTLIQGEHYYIQPLTLENGLIQFPSSGGGWPSLPSGNPIGGFTYGEGSGVYGSGSFRWSFDCDLTYGGSRSGYGSGVGSGARLVIQVTFGDGSTYYIYVDLQEGSHHYEGSSWVDLPSLKKGPISVDMWVEGYDEDDIYYWFVKAGSLWGFDSEISREDVGEYDALQGEAPVRRFEWLILSSFYSLEYEGSPKPGPTDVEIGEIFRLFSNSYSQFIRSQLIELFAEFSLNSGYKTEGIYIKPLTDVEVRELLKLLDDLGLSTTPEIRHQIEEIFKMKDEAEMKLDSGFSISYQ